uniref:Uncharacterized protein n=1 Tax=Mola mola TaxID=94237 RepID=A0A3Q3W042_MOLML
MTSKNDSPPPYEDALHQPKYGNYPLQPQHGCPLPPPPSYKGVYPQETSQDLGSSCAKGEDFLFILSHTDFYCVYLILAAQLAVTISVVSVFTFADPVRLFVIRYPGIYWASFVVYFVVYLRPCASCFILQTLALSYMCGTISSYYETKAVFLAMGITAAVCIAVTVFCFQTKVDFTSCAGFLCIAAVSLMIIGIVTAIILSFQYVPWLHMLYAAIGAIIYTLFLVYNTQLLIGNRELAISPEEYVYGALSLYIDIVHIFLFILQVSGAATD